MLEIKDAVAVITGGAGGIGLEIAKYWVNNGGKVVIADIAQNLLDQAEAELTAMGGEVATVVCNVTKEEDNAKLADKAIEKFGRINLIAPFAGIIKDELMVVLKKETGKVIRKMSLDQFKQVIDINLTGVFLTVRESRRAHDQQQLQGAYLSRFLHGVPWNRGPDQLFLLQGRHFRHAQGDHRGIPPPRSFR